MLLNFIITLYKLDIEKADKDLILEELKASKKFI